MSEVPVDDPRGLGETIAIGPLDPTNRTVLHEVALFIIREVEGSRRPRVDDVLLSVRQLSSPTRTTLVARADDGEIVATAGLRSERGSDEGRLVDVAATSGRRRRGLGTLVVRAAEQEARSQGLVSLALEDSSENHGFYQRLGYVQIGENEKEYSKAL